MLTFSSRESETKWPKAVLEKTHSQIIENGVGILPNSIVPTKFTETQRFLQSFVLYS